MQLIKNYPDPVIGDIEPSPSSDVDRQIRWIDRLQKRLHEPGDKGLDFHRVDPDWVAFQVAYKGPWSDLKKIADHCHAAGLKFSVIYLDSGLWPTKKSGTLSDFGQGFCATDRPQSVGTVTPFKFLVKARSHS